MRMRELADAVLLSRSGLTRLVDRMERAGLVTRTPDAADRRVVRVALTDAGTAAYRDARAEHRSAVAEHFLDRLTAAEAATIERALERVLEASR
jgi:DNA-binding MarR family transcriptional regulator